MTDLGEKDGMVDFVTSVDGVGLPWGACPLQTTHETRCKGIEGSAPVPVRSIRSQNHSGGRRKAAFFIRSIPGA